ncbi:MAG: DUF6624 domain-containing protein [Bacteroidota bacterium]
MHKHVLLLLTSLFVLSCYHLFAQETPPKYPDLAKELIAMRKPDQKLRIQYVKLLQTGKQGTKRYERVRDRLIATDRQNTARMREIVEEYGWPTYDLVGRRASSAAWILVQHADRSPLFQAHCLKLLKAAVDEGQASPRNYAYLYDRVQLAFGNKQLYATQTTKNEFTKQSFFQTIEDEAGVQERRAAMDIEEHVVDYAARNGFTYTVPTEQEAQNRADSIAQTYAKYSQLAKAAMAAENYAEAVDYYMWVNYCDGHTTAEDYYELARAISLADHKHKTWASYFLRKAILRGHAGGRNYDTNPDLENIKNANPDNWAEMLATREEMHKFIMGLEINKR